jgi:hypothetical protein
MFSQFCSYVTSYDFGFTSHRTQVQMLIKTTDGGSSWTDVHQSNPEYAQSPSVCNYISDNGQDIYTMIFYGSGPEVGGHAPSQNDYYPNDGFIFKILFNYSKDGGTTWAYPSGSWKLIDGTNVENGFVQNTQLSFESSNNNYYEQRRKNYISIYYNKETNEIIVGYIVLEGQEYVQFKISRDNGNTWENPHSPFIENLESTPYTILGKTSSPNIVPFLGENYSPINFSASNDLFCAFYVYNSYSNDDPVATNPFSVHDYVFESTSYGYTGLLPDYESTRNNDSSLFITHTNNSAKISKIKGYYV